MSGIERRIDRVEEQVEGGPRVAQILKRLHAETYAGNTDTAWFEREMLRLSLREIDAVNWHIAEWFRARGIEPRTEPMTEAEREEILARIAVLKRELGLPEAASVRAPGPLVRPLNGHAAPITPPPAQTPQQPPQRFVRGNKPSLPAPPPWDGHRPAPMVLKQFRYNPATRKSEPM